MRPAKPSWFAMAAMAILLLFVALPGGSVLALHDPRAGDPTGVGLPSAAPEPGCDIANAAWVGTTDQGLVCLDDAGWHVFTAESAGLPGDDVRDVAIAPDGRVRVAQLQGLSVTDGAAWETYEPALWGSNVPEAVAIGPDGSVWLAHLGGVSRFDGTTWTTWPVAELGLRGDAEYPQSISVAPDGTVWVATTNSLAAFDGTRWTTYTAGAGLDDEYYFDDVLAGPAGVWAAHSDGVLGWNGTAWLANGGDGLVYSQTLALDPEGRVWVGSWLRGASVFDRVGWLTYDRQRSGLSSDSVESIAVDGQGRVWAATNYGLDVFADGAWTSFQMQDSGLPDDVTTAVAVSGVGPALPPRSEKARGSLSGVALEGGAPIAAATVVLCTETTTYASADSTPCAIWPFSMQATTEPDGAFAFEGVPVGRYDLIIQGASGEWASAVQALGPLGERFVVQEGAPTDVGSIDIAADDE